jgi:uncharacterized protein (TIGR02246 family)
MEMLMRKFQFYMAVAALLLMASIGAAQTAQSNQKPSKNSQSMSASKGKSSLEETISMMERRAWEAVKARDAKTFSNLFAADGTMADSDGVMTRDAFLNKTLPDLVITDYTLSDIKVMMIDKDSALITYTAMAKGTFKGQAVPDAPSYTSSIWTKRNGKWLAVYHQETMAR